MDLIRSHTSLLASFQDATSLEPTQPGVSSAADSPPANRCNPFGINAIAVARLHLVRTIRLRVVLTMALHEPKDFRNESSGTNTSSSG